MATNPKCKNTGHKKHLCAIKERGFDKKYPEKFREITKNPQQKCGLCGAKANKSENLCKPVKL